MGIHTTTRTHTNYFGGDDIEELRVVAAKIREDWESRKPYIDSDTAHGGDVRLSALECAIELAADPAP